MKSPYSLFEERSDEMPLEFIISIISKGFILSEISSLKSMGLSPKNYRFLEVLSYRDEIIIQKDFAEMFKKNQSTITRSLNTLEDDGFIKRINDDINHKNKIIVLTKKGKDTVNTMTNFKRNLEDQYLDSFTTSEKEELRKNLIIIAKKFLYNLHEK